jgi:hypothetical protein
MTAKSAEYFTVCPDFEHNGGTLEHCIIFN